MGVVAIQNKFHQNVFGIFVHFLVHFMLERTFCFCFLFDVFASMKSYLVGCFFGEADHTS